MGFSNSLTSLLYTLLFFSLSAYSETFHPHPSSKSFRSRTANTSSTSVTRAAASELDILRQGRVDAIIGAQTNVDIPSWLSTLGGDGKWSDVNYATGCAAQRANWPAQTHWFRLTSMASAWHGGLPNADQYVNNATLASIISTSMNWWFDRDFQNPACLTDGGTDSCPCDPNDQTLWNTNWFSNVIGTPMQVAATCLLMQDALSSTQLSNCTHMTARAYGTFQGNFGFLAGANILDIAKIGIDNGILNQNVSLVTDAYRRIHNEVRVQPGVMVDGIKADGSFGQHTGLLYNGNYGKDYTNDVLDLEVAAAGTQFAANETSKSAMELLFDGDSWMIYRNTQTGTLHWDFSTLPRFISFPIADSQATANINLNLTKIGQLGAQWQSSSLAHFAQLSQDTSSVNAGQLVGIRHFYANDYIVHRGSNYVSTVKMYSKRTKNTECTNSQNPLGFHLADGAQYNYIIGNEYEDIAASWDWNLIPGITVDYAATALTCNKITFTGIESFVGGVSTDTTGLAVMRYTNPNIKSLRFQKAWFFLDGDMQYVMISNITSTTKAQVYSVLDQRRHTGPIVVDSQEVTLEENKITNFTNFSTLWHGGVGYSFETNNATALSLNVGPKTGNWSSIGTSTQPPATVDLYAAWLHHTTVASPIAYSVFPGTANADAFLQRKNAAQVHVVQNDGTASALFDNSARTIMIAYWAANGGCVTVADASITVCSSANAVVIYDVDTNTVTTSDPSQILSSVDLTFKTSSGDRTVSLTLPTGGDAGKSVSQKIV
ncbi:polysaccharide lyase family 8 protein [Marasmius fiardii PR-910]|nr:polysaccharide lyase family 8 protein [Marasmius fiardii PR-910]